MSSWANAVGRRFARAAFAALLAPLSAAAAAAEVAPAGRLGSVHIEQPAEVARGISFFFSDSGGWTDADQAVVDALARRGLLAVGVDTDAFLANVSPIARPCSELVGDVEGLSQKLQRSQAHGEYHYPILTGVGAGGALAQLILTGAPANTLSGAATLDPHPEPPGDLTCTGAPAHISGFWSVALSPAAPAPIRDAVETAQKSGAPVEISAAVGADAAAALTALIEPRLDAADAERGVADLPLVELPSARPSPLLVVMLSGDGGWRDLDKTLAEQLQRDGVSVVGWDSLRYFWRKKTPEETAAALADVIQTYRSKWNADKVGLVGYSFGADVLPAAYNLLPEAVRSHVVQMSLMGLESGADWEIRIAGWLGAAPSAEASPIAPALKGVPAAMIQCFYGESELGSDCPALAASGAELIRTSGSHHFGGDYVGLAKRILDGLVRRAGGLSLAP